jgi:hypothetical protein
MLVGCNSFSSTLLQRFDDNSFAGQSNGQSLPHQQTRPFKGIPITLTVPTHLDVFIDETYFVRLTPEKADELLSGKVRFLDVRTEVVESEKVFTVDFKRPASGILDLDMTFDQEEQYFQKIASELSDTTITDAANLVSTSMKAISGLQAASNSGGSRSDADLLKRLRAVPIEMDVRVVAYHRFDINSPTFEEDLCGFVNDHLNAWDVGPAMPVYDAM